MPRFQIKAHYDPGRVIVGIVTASSKREALYEAEAKGMLDDPDAVDFTAHELAPEPRPNLSDILGEALKKHSE